MPGLYAEGKNMITFLDTDLIIKSPKYNKFTKRVPFN